MPGLQTSSVSLCLTCMSTIDHSQPDHPSSDDDDDSDSDSDDDDDDDDDSSQHHRAGCATIGSGQHSVSKGAVAGIVIGVCKLSFAKRHLH